MYNKCIMSGHGYINFEWDDNKAAINLRKHGVSFESIRTRYTRCQALGLRRKVLPHRNGSGNESAHGVPLRKMRRLKNQDNPGQKIDENGGTAILEVPK